MQRLLEYGPDTAQIPSGTNVLFAGLLSQPSAGSVPCRQTAVDSEEVERILKIETEFSHLVSEEPFRATKADGIFRLRHAKWSVMGEGATLLDAEQALLDEARIDAEVFLEIPLEELSADAIAYRRFLLRIVK